MKITDIITEAPLTDYQPLGDFNKPGPFRNPVDKKLAVHPVNIMKAYKFFENTPFDIRIFPANIPGLSKHRESGEMNPAMIRNTFSKENADKILAGHEDAITIVYVGNSGDARAMFTPWIMAHRFGHGIQATNRWFGNKKDTSEWKAGEDHFFKAVNDMLEEYYGDGYDSAMSGRNDSVIKWNMTPEYNALFNAIGTQKSSRDGKIRRPYEFLYELFAQYLGTGKVTLNPLPTNLGYGRKAWGNPSRYLNMKPEHRNGNDRTYATEVLASDMEQMFYDVLSNQVGKIVIM